MSFTTQYHELYKQISENFIRKQMSGALENYATPLISKLQPDDISMSFNYEDKRFHLGKFYYAEGLKQ